MRVRVKKAVRISKQAMRQEAMIRAEELAGSSEVRYELIQLLLPLGLAAVGEQMQREVEQLTGRRYERNSGECRRWGSNPGSVYLGGQKVCIEVPRVRNVEQRREVPLESYQAFQEPKIINEKIYRALMSGLSGRRYQEVAEVLPETFGVSKSAVSRRFKNATAQRLAELMERDLSKLDIVGIFLDGKHLAEMDMVIALGITIAGDKIPLGFIETSTENAKVCKDFLAGLIARGLSAEQEVLFIIDGGKGLHKGIQEVFGSKAIIQRCQWHKRENVLKYLGKEQVPIFRKKLQAAYQQPTYEKAKARLKLIRKELSLINQSAVTSLDEGFEETLTLHRLGLFKELGRSFKTTNCIEALNSQVANRTDRVSYWKNSEQRQRWIAMALLEIEPALNRVQGASSLRLLRERMKASRQVLAKEAA